MGQARPCLHRESQGSSCVGSVFWRQLAGQDRERLSASTSHSAGCKCIGVKWDLCSYCSHRVQAPLKGCAIHFYVPPLVRAPPPNFC